MNFLRLSYPTSERTVDPRRNEEHDVQGGNRPAGQRPWPTGCVDIGTIDFVRGSFHVLTADDTPGPRKKGIKSR